LSIKMEQENEFVWLLWEGNTRDDQIKNQDESESNEPLSS
jgi:hypothetical protein